MTAPDPAALAAWNAANQRARAEYELYPIATTTDRPTCAGDGCTRHPRPRLLLPTLPQRSRAAHDQGDPMSYDGPFWWHAEEAFKAREEARHRGIDDDRPKHMERGRYSAEEAPSRSELRMVGDE